MTEDITCEIIIPARNAAPTLQSCLSAAKASITSSSKLILVDHGSEDETKNIAQQYCDEIRDFPCEQDRYSLRKQAYYDSSAEYVIFLDADIVVQENTFDRLHEYMVNNEDIAAMSCHLASEPPCESFFGDYKNLYMDYRLHNIQKPVDFIYGSCFIIRRQPSLQWPEIHTSIGDDTYLGQGLFHRGKKLALLSDTGVVHLKDYRLSSLIRNDFSISKCWGGILWYWQNDLRLAAKSFSFSHCNVEQACALGFATCTSVFALSAFVFPFVEVFFLTILLFVSWSIVNTRYFRFLYRKRSGLRGLLMCFYVYLDDIVHAAGALSGIFLYAPWRKHPLKP